MAWAEDAPPFMGDSDDGEGGAGGGRPALFSDDFARVRGGQTDSVTGMDPNGISVRWPTALVEVESWYKIVDLNFDPVDENDSMVIGRVHATFRRTISRRDDGGRGGGRQEKVRLTSMIDNAGEVEIKVSQE